MGVSGVEEVPRGYFVGTPRAAPGVPDPAMADAEALSGAEENGGERKDKHDPP